MVFIYLYFAYYLSICESQIVTMSVYCKHYVVDLRLLEFFIKLTSSVCVSSLFNMEFKFGESVHRMMCFTSIFTLDVHRDLESIVTLVRPRWWALKL